MDKILPKATSPFQALLPRVHRPPGRAANAWKHFRDCLRWEFGFTCAICLLHERDFVPPHTGAARTGQLAVEHFVPRSVDSSRTNDYANCLYLCRFCNGTKSNAPVVDPVTKASLVNPVEAVWATHFERDGDELRPLTPEGVYTRDTYGVNDVIRVERRRSRYALVSDLHRCIQGRLADIEALDHELADPALPPESRLRKVSQRGRWRGELRRAVEDLRALTGVPRDRPERCRCDAARAVSPPISDGWIDPPNITIGEAPGAPARAFRT